jgi:hypothetical protein
VRKRIKMEKNNQIRKVEKYKTDKNKLPKGGTHSPYQEIIEQQNHKHPVSSPRLSTAPSTGGS